MSHVRTQLRDVVASLLSIVPAGVHKSRRYTVNEMELPAVLVYTNAEAIDSDTDAGFLVFDRVLQLVVEPIVQAVADVDTVLDDLIAAVEVAIGVDIALGGLALHCLLRGIEVEMTTEGAQPLARARMTYEVLYRTTFTDPTVTA